MTLNRNGHAIIQDVCEKNMKLRFIDSRNSLLKTALPDGALKKQRRTSLSSSLTCKSGGNFSYSVQLNLSVATSAGTAIVDLPQTDATPSFPKDG